MSSVYLGKYVFPTDLASDRTTETGATLTWVPKWRMHTSLPGHLGTVMGWTCLFRRVSFCLIFYSDTCDLLNSFCHLLLYLLSTISFLSEFFCVIFNWDPERNLTSSDQHLLISILSLRDCRGKLQYSLKLLILTGPENTGILKQLVQIKNQFPENPYKTWKQKTMTGKTGFCLFERYVWILIQSDEYLETCQVSSTYLLIYATCNGIWHS